MDSYHFHDIRVEKANAISKHRRVQRFTTLFRIAEAFVFLVVVSRFTTNFAFSFPTEYFRGISAVDLISPRSVFVLGNVIVIALFLISGRISGKRSPDLYDEYVEKCRNNNNINNHQTWRKEAIIRIPESDAREEKVLSRTHSANIERAVHVRRLRRSVSEQCRKTVPAAVAEEMSSEQFRQTVEAFIARQKCCLREEEEFSA